MKKFFTALLVMLLLALPASAEVIISEVMASNGTYKNGEAYDWVELHNTGSKNVSLDGCFLSDSRLNRQKWQFPKGASIKAGGYVLVYCTGEDMNPGKNSTFYANFKISASGDQVYLTAADGETPMAFADLPDQYGNVSWGKAEGSDQHGFFYTATPGKKNEKTVYAARAAQPVLMTPGGFYEEAVTVLAKGEEGTALRYTLDGNTPTEKSRLFPAEGLTFEKTSVLRVAAFAENCVPSQPACATYFIGESQRVPVISIVTDYKYLFDKKTGALVKGSGSTPNYHEEWEYPANIEFYGMGSTCEINQMGTFTAAGHSARQNAQKSIAVYARKAYGEDRFYFNPFPNRDYDSYKSLLIRGANSDAFSTRLRDVVISSLAEPLDIIYQDALAIEVYINGQYWGHYNLREKINKHFIAQWEGVTNEKDIDNIDILARTGRDEFVQNGDNEDWLALCDFCKTHDLNVQENLAYVEERLDIDSLFTHAAFEIIIGNDDFTNIRVYRVPGGKWKYLLFDVEAGFLSMDKEPMNYYLKKMNAKIQGFRHEPMTALLNVPEMKARFLTRFAEVLEISFLWPNVEQAFLPWEETLEILLPRHLDRWPHFTMDNWRQNVDAVKYYGRVRPTKIVAMLQKHMKLTDAEVELYFGEVQKLLEEENILK